MADKEEMTSNEEVEEYPEEEYELTDADVDEVAREVVEPEDREAEEIEEIVEQYVSPGEEGRRRVRQAIRRAEAERAQREAGASDLTPEEIEEAMEEAFESTDVDDKVFETPKQDEKKIDIGGKKKGEKDGSEGDKDKKKESKKEVESAFKKAKKRYKKSLKVTKSDYKELNKSRSRLSGGVGKLVATSRGGNLLVADRGPGQVGGPIYYKEEGPQAGFTTYPHKVQRPFETEPRSEIKLATQSKSGSKIELGARITPPTISAKPKSKPPTLSAGRGRIGSIMARGGLGAGFASLIPKTSTASKKKSKKKAKIARKGRVKSKKSTKKMTKKSKTKRKASKSSPFGGSFPFKVRGG